MNVHRRAFLRATGVAMALPLFEAFNPRRACAATAERMPAMPIIDERQYVVPTRNLVQIEIIALPKRCLLLFRPC